MASSAAPRPSSRHVDTGVGRSAAGVRASTRRGCRHCRPPREGAGVCGQVASGRASRIRAPTIDAEKKKQWDTAGGFRSKRRPAMDMRTETNPPRRRHRPSCLSAGLDVMGRGQDRPPVQRPFAGSPSRGADRGHVGGRISLPRSAFAPCCSAPRRCSAAAVSSSSWRRSRR